MKLPIHDVFRRLGDGDPIAVVCGAAGIERDEFVREGRKTGENLTCFGDIFIFCLTDEGFNMDPHWTTY